MDKPEVKFEEEASNSQIGLNPPQSSQRLALNGAPLVSPAVSHRLERQDTRSMKKSDTHSLAEDGMDLEVLNSMSMTNRMRRGDIGYDPSLDQVYEIKIQCNDGQNRSFLFQEYIHSTIGDLKNEFFPAEMLTKTFRVIYQGKLLKDHDLVSNLKVQSSRVLHVFLTDKIRPDIKSIPTETIIETKNNIRGFDFFRDFALSEEDIIWKRFRFHNEYILVEKLEFIDDDFLVNREELFLTGNQELKQDHQKFRRFEFSDQNSQSVSFFPEGPKNLKRVYRVALKLLLFILGFLLFFFGFLIVVIGSARRRGREVLEYQWLFLGSLAKLVASLVLYVVLGKSYFFIPFFL